MTGCRQRELRGASEAIDGDSKRVVWCVEVLLGAIGHSPGSQQVAESTSIVAMGQGRFRRRPSSSSVGAEERELDEHMSTKATKQHNRELQPNEPYD